MKKRITALFIAAVITTALIIPASAASDGFSDVPSLFWAYNEIMSASANGITGGYDDGTFRPGNSVTNAHFSAFLARAFYADECNDTGASTWYKPYTDTLENHGIYTKPSYMTGINTLGSNLDENVNKPINRYDMAQMMYHILKDKNAKMPSNAEMAAARNAIGDWDSVPAEYRGGVSLCYAMGVLNGQSDGNFGGNNLMNRGQGCVVVYRLTQKIGTGSTGIEPSVPEKPEEPSNPSSGTQTLSNGKAVTEGNVAELLDELKSKYPHGDTFDVSSSYYFSAMNANGHDCAKLAFMVSDDIFGVNVPIYSHVDYNNIRLGDIIEHRDENGNTHHWSIVNTVDVSPNGRDYVKVVSGNSNGLIKWNAIYYPDQFDNEVVWTRYPQ